VVGYGVKNLPKGTVIAGFNNDRPLAADTVVTDSTKEYLSPASFLVDLMAAYDLPVSNRDRRYRLQLNVRNLLDRDDLMPSLADSNGVVQQWAFQYPREVLLSLNATF